MDAGKRLAVERFLLKWDSSNKLCVTRATFDWLLSKEGVDLRQRDAVTGMCTDLREREPLLVNYGKEFGSFVERMLVGVPAGVCACVGRIWPGELDIVERFAGSGARQFFESRMEEGEWVPWKWLGASDKEPGVRVAVGISAGAKVRRPWDRRYGH